LGVRRAEQQKRRCEQPKQGANADHCERMLALIARTFTCLNMYESNVTTC
jgi:hypothetical protein